MVVPYYSYYLYFPLAAWVGASAGFRRHGLLFFQRMINADVDCLRPVSHLPVEIELRSQAQGAEGLFGVLMTALHEGRYTLQRLALYPRPAEHPRRVLHSPCLAKERDVDDVQKYRCMDGLRFALW